MSQSDRGRKRGAVCLVEGVEHTEDGLAGETAGPCGSQVSLPAQGEHRAGFVRYGDQQRFWAGKPA
jgi:hypothetical protein